eukprot:747661-Hanusia_phi.AAC.4
MYERAMSAGPTNYSQQRAVTNIDAIRTKGNMDTGTTSHVLRESADFKQIHGTARQVTFRKLLRTFKDLKVDKLTSSASRDASQHQIRVEGLDEFADFLLHE